MKSVTPFKKYLYLLITCFVVIDPGFAQSSYFYYSFNADPWTFNRRNDDGSAQLTVYTPALYQISAAAVDGSNNKLYFYESTSNNIFKANYDGSGKSSAFVTSGAITSLAAGNGYIFYAYSGVPYSVRRCNADGTGDTQIYLNPSFGTVMRIAIDAANNYVYYYERGYDNVNNRIFRTDIGGTNFTVVYNNCPNVQSLTAGGGYFYYGLNAAPWTFNRRNADGSSQILIYTPPAGTVMECAYDASINKIFYYDNAVSGAGAIFKADPDGANTTTLYSGFTQVVNALAASTAGKISFADGSGFAQSITANTADQVLGRFQLVGTTSGATLTAASIKLNNARTGLSNFKLWSSTDASFGSDAQLGATIAADPGVGGSVSFTGIASPVSASGTYFFLTADVASSASGTVQAVVVQNSNVTITNGTLTGTIANASLSNNTVTLPVELAAFTASAGNHNVTLRWKTATEVNNYGFDVERLLTADRDRKTTLSTNTGIAGSQTGEAVERWTKIGFVAGSGNSNASRSYAFVDHENTAEGKYAFYRLKQIDNDGAFTYSPEIEGNTAVPTNFSVDQNFPNPFNPSTKISWRSPVGGRQVLTVYDALGKEVTTVMDEYRDAGTYEVDFDASALSGGIYFYKIVSGKNMEIRKMVLLK